MPAQTFHLEPDGELRTDLAPRQVAEAVAGGEGALWVDITDGTDVDGEYLAEVFGFHPVTIRQSIDDVLNLPKLELFKDHVYLVVRGIDYSAESDLLETTELNLFLGRNYVVTNHNLFLYSVEELKRRVQDGEGLMADGATPLAAAILEAFTEKIAPGVDYMGDVADTIEDEVLVNPVAPLLEAIMNLRRSAIRLSKALRTQADAIYRLAGDRSGLVEEGSGLRFRDAAERVVRFENSCDNLRERMDTALAIYMSSVANHQNEVMKTLAVVATIFMPLTLLVGIYGMNFGNIPELAWGWAYYGVLGTMGAFFIGAVWLTWLRGRLGVSGRRIRFRPATVAQTSVHFRGLPDRQRGKVA